MTKKSMTLVEVVVAMAVLVVVLLGVGAALTASLHATRDAKPNLIAQDAGQRLLEELRNRDFTSIYPTFWDGAAKKTFDRAPWAVRDAQGVMQRIVDEHLVAALDAGVMLPSSGGERAANGDPLRLRFLGEAEFHRLWGSSLDLDFPADPTVQDEPQPGQKLYPVLIQVHYRDARGDRVYQLGALIHEEAPLDRRP